MEFIALTTISFLSTTAAWTLLNGVLAHRPKHEKIGLDLMEEDWRNS